MTKKYLKISVLSFLYITLVLHGLQRISGLFIIELSKGTESISHQDAAIPFIYSWAVAKIVASFSDFLIDDKSSELVVFCGVLLCSMGAALCILDTDITAITVFWGFIFGSGYGLASPHLTKNISNEDSSKLSLFKEVPSSFGISIMPFLLDVIIVQYGLQGSFIIFSGIILQYVPFALAAAYNIEIRIPNIKWRVRKKSNQYFIPKQEGKKTASIESLNNSLEPDFVVNVTQSTDISAIPIDIKVHIEEYTFAVDREYRSNSFDSNDSGYGISDETNYSHSRFIEESEYLKHENQNPSRNILKDVDSNANSSNIYSVFNTSKFDSKNKSIKSNKAMRLNISKDRLKSKFLRILKFFNNVISPISLCIIVITIIFETSLITLLTNISDFVNNTDRDYCDFTWILVAFGVGGLFGKLCCYKISKTISEKSHTVGVILFLLTGLSIAGVLYSPNLNWLASFYSILGALEGGISYILPKFILDYTHKDVQHVISSTKNFLSGVAIICLPSLLGLLPDEMGDYEFLLQTLSCLSILCACLVYFLPCLKSISNKGNIASFKDKMNRV